MIYEFKCKKCGHEFEIITYDKEIKGTACKRCFGPAVKIISASANRNSAWSKECK